MSEITRRQFVAGASSLGLGLATVRPKLLSTTEAATSNRLTAHVTNTNILRIAISGNIETRDPFKSDYANSDEVNDFNIYDQFFTYGTKRSTQSGILLADPTVVKGLTVSDWTLASDQLSVVLHVRPGMTFHRTLNPVTADDVIFFLNRAKVTPASGPGAFYNLAKITSYTKTGPMQVTVNFSAPSPWFYQLFFQDNMGLYDSVDVLKHATSADPFGAHYIATTDVASGPYEVASYSPESRIVLQAFPGYWGAAPHFGKVQVSFVTEESERVLLLKTGAIDIAEELGANSLKSLKGAPGIKIVNVPSANQALIGFNVTEFPFNNEKLRQAVAYATPYQQIVSKVLGGNARVSKGIVPLVSPYHDSSTYPWTFNQAKARKLLKAAGHPHGFNFHLIYETGNSTDQQILVYLQTSLKEVGINMTLEEMSASTFSTAINTLKARQAYYTELVWFVQDPGYIGNFVSADPVTDFLQPTGYSNPKVSPLVKAMDFVVNTPALKAKKQKLASEYQKIMNGSASYIFLGDLNFQRAMRSDISNFVLYPNLETRYRDLI